MKERPILFSGPMVKAILEGRKTQTRRVMKPQPPEGALDKTLCWPRGGDGMPRRWLNRFGLMYGVDSFGDGIHIEQQFIPCPYGAPGDRLWVREAFHQHYEGGVLGGRPHYKADGCIHSKVLGWKPSIHMPRWASRITLEIADVRVERLQDISEEDAIAEGIQSLIDIDPANSPKYVHPVSKKTQYPSFEKGTLCYSAVASFSTLWDTVNGRRASWDSNPWVWVVEFAKL